jgi:hypothetical protein
MHIHKSIFTRHRAKNRQMAPLVDQRRSTSINVGYLAFRNTGLIVAAVLIRVNRDHNVRHL